MPLSHAVPAFQIVLHLDTKVLHPFAIDFEVLEDALEAEKVSVDGVRVGGRYVGAEEGFEVGIWALAEGCEEVFPAFFGCYVEVEEVVRHCAGESLESSEWVAVDCVYLADGYCLVGLIL